MTYHENILNTLRMDHEIFRFNVREIKNKLIFLLRYQGYGTLHMVVTNG